MPSSSASKPSHPPMPRGLPRSALTPEQQLEAIRRTQAQAEQRVKLGVQLFKAAEARVAAQQDLLAEVRREQQGLREQVQQDVAKSLRSYDQWMGRIDESFTHAIDRLNQRVDRLEETVRQQADEAKSLIQRAEALMRDPSMPTPESASHDDIPATYPLSLEKPSGTSPKPADDAGSDEAVDSPYRRLLDQLRSLQQEALDVGEDDDADEDTEPGPRAA